jgi:phasin
METMPKTTETTKNTEFATFDTATAAEQVRAVAEQGVVQSKEVLAKFNTDTERTQKALQTSFETAKTVSGELSLRAIATLRANAEAGFSQLEALVAVKSPSEFFELQTSFWRKQFEKSIEQAKEFQAVTTNAAEEISKPIKSVFEKAIKGLNVA